LKTDDIRGNEEIAMITKLVQMITRGNSFKLRLVPAAYTLKLVFDIFYK
jgi:hypothetical protein